ncbi:STKc_PknB_like domain containing protein [Mycobacteriaceae bacterium]
MGRRGFGDDGMPLAVGAEFAGFRIVRELGAGAMGQVYLVEHPRLPRQEAVKVLSEHYTDNQEYRQRFQREAELAASLWHPHLVALHDRGEDNGRLWISMDYIDGTDTARLVRTRYPTGMPVAEAVAIIAAVASALDYAHGRGMLHRDVKPSNILVSEGPFHEQRIALADFGIARAIDDMVGLTSTNFAIGTVEYAAPEQLRGRAIDTRADQYALAATAFQLLTGSPPFTGSSPVEVISQHLTEPPPSLGDSRPELRSFDGVFTQALAKDPAARFNNCGEFASKLDALVSSHKAWAASAPLVTPRIAPDSPTMAAAKEARSSAPFPRGPVPGLPPTMPAHSYNEDIHRADTQLAAPARVPSQPSPVRQWWERRRVANPAAIALVAAAVALTGVAVWGGAKNPTPDTGGKGDRTFTDQQREIVGAESSASAPASTTKRPPPGSPFDAPPLQLQPPGYVTDMPGVLSSGQQKAKVDQEIDRLFDSRNVRLWVIYAEEAGRGISATETDTGTFTNPGAVVWVVETRLLVDRYRTITERSEGGPYIPTQPGGPSQSDFILVIDTVRDRRISDNYFYVLVGPTERGGLGGGYYGRGGAQILCESAEPDNAFPSGPTNPCTNGIEPALSRGDWAGAAVAAIRGIEAIP